jgi:hypothetical protein
MASYRARFGEHIPFIQRQDVKGFLRRKPVWLAKALSVQRVRKEVELMEAESMRFLPNRGQASDKPSHAQAAR